MGARGRESFASNMTAIMAMAGSAIGLGNIWRFPYMVGQNGGASFIVLYIVAAVFLALPIFMAEAIIGRNTQSNTFGAMEKLAPGTAWKWMGLLTVITPLILVSYYSVVGGWSVGYFFRSVFCGFGVDTAERFSAFSSSWWRPLLCYTLFMGITLFIVYKGVKKGIERFNKLSMPLLFVLIVTVAAYSVTLPGAGAGVCYLLKPDFSLLSAKTFAYAMGQAFFSLSLGVGTILTYSSYLSKNSDLLKSGTGTAGFDILFAIVAGFAVMPAVFAAGMEPGAGPGLVFESIPYVFAQMGGVTPLLSRMASILFFLVIVVAALTSSISMCEVGVAYLVEEKSFSRGRAVLVLFSITWLLGCLCSLGFGPLSGLKIFGKDIFSFCDWLVSNFLMTFGALLFVIFAGWKMDYDGLRDEFTNGGTLKRNGRIFDVLYFLIRYIAPVAIAVIFVMNF